MNEKPEVELNSREVLDPFITEEEARLLTSVEEEQPPFSLLTVLSLCLVVLSLVALGTGSSGLASAFAWSGAGLGVAGGYNARRRRLGREAEAKRKVEVRESRVLRCADGVRQELFYAAMYLWEFEDSQRADFRSLWETMVEANTLILERSDWADRSAAREALKIRAKAICEAGQERREFNRALEADRARRLKELQVPASQLLPSDDSDVELARCYAQALREARERLSTEEAARG